MRAEATKRGCELLCVTDEQFAALTGQPMPEKPKLKIDADGTAIGPDGQRFYALRNSEAQTYRRYIEAKSKASALGLELRIVADDEVTNAT